MLEKQTFACENKKIEIVGDRKVYRVTDSRKKKKRQQDRNDRPGYLEAQNVKSFGLVPD